MKGLLIVLLVAGLTAVGVGADELDPGPCSPAQSVAFENGLVHEIPEMHDVRILRRAYGVHSLGNERVPLKVDLFYPPQHDGSESLPVALFMTPCPGGDAGNAATVREGFGMYEDWARLLAAAGMVAVTYDATTAADTARVVSYLEDYAPVLRVRVNGYTLAGVNAVSGFDVTRYTERDCSWSTYIVE